MNYQQLPDALLPYIRRWSGMQVAVWCDVYTMTMNGRSYYRTNDQLAEMFGTDPRTVRRLVQDLVKEGALSTRMDGKRRILTATKLGDWSAPQRRTDMSEDRNVRGQIYPGTDMSAKEDRNVRDGGQICPPKEDRYVPQIDNIIEQVINKEVDKGAPKLRREGKTVVLDTKARPFDVDEVIDYFLELEDTPEEAANFYDYWTSAGWRRKAGPIKDWKATARTWVRSPYRKPKPKTVIDTARAVMEDFLNNPR